MYISVSTSRYIKTNRDISLLVWEASCIFRSPCLSKAGLQPDSQLKLLKWGLANCSLLPDFVQPMS